MIFLLLGKVSIAFSGLILYIPFAFILTGFQSIVFSFVMEFFVLPKISYKYYVILIGLTLGILSSFFMGAVFCVVGALVGAMTSNFLFGRYNTANKPIRG